MSEIIAFIYQHIDYFPIVAIVSLLLAAFNIPISEDLLIITGALLSHEKPERLVYNLLALYFGVIAGDFLLYWIASKIRKGTAKAAFFVKVAPEKALNKMKYFLDKYGILTFIICRFIPFGIRNILFFTAGFSGLRLRYFVVNDLIAAMISINTLFFLTYFLGEAAEKPLKIVGLVLFIVLVSTIVSLIIRFIVSWRKSKNKSAELPQ